MYLTTLKVIKIISLVDELTISHHPGGSVCKESTHNAGDLGSVPGLGRSPGEGNGSPLQCSCLENHHGQRSLEGCSPWGRKELDITEQISTCIINHSIIFSSNS